MEKTRRRKKKKKKIEEEMNQGKGLVETLDSLGEDDKARMAFTMEQLQVRDRSLSLSLLSELEKNSLLNF